MDDQGWRVRGGILVIHDDPTPEREFRLLAPPGCDFYAARMQSPRRKGEQYDTREVHDYVEHPDLVRGIEMLGDCPLDFIAVCYTTGSLYFGLEWDRAVEEKVAALPRGIVGVGGGTSVVAAMKALDIRRPMLMTPPWFSDDLLESAVEFIENEADARPVGIHRAYLHSGWVGADPPNTYDASGQWEQDPGLVYRHARSLDYEDADGLVTVGSGLRIAEVIDTLESDLRLPVATANQTLLWYGLRRSGVHEPIKGSGSLLEMQLP